VLRQAPSILSGADLKALIRDVLADLLVHAQSDRLQDAVTALLLTVAYHGSVRAHRKLTVQG
jgi:DNA mismatch repair protein MutL